MCFGTNANTRKLYFYRQSMATSLIAQVMVFGGPKTSARSPLSRKRCDLSGKLTISATQKLQRRPHHAHPCVRPLGPTNLTRQPTLAME
jgi:hypothetical protein